MSRETGDNQNRNLSLNEPMESVLTAYLSRRSVVRGGLGAAIAMIAGTGLTGCFDSGGGSDNDTPTQPPKPALKLGFNSIPGSSPMPAPWPPATPPTCWPLGVHR